MTNIEIPLKCFKQFFYEREDFLSGLSIHDYEEKKEDLKKTLRGEKKDILCTFKKVRLRSQPTFLSRVFKDVFLGKIIEDAFTYAYSVSVDGITNSFSLKNTDIYMIRVYSHDQTSYAEVPIVSLFHDKEYCFLDINPVELTGLDIAIKLSLEVYCSILQSHTIRLSEETINFIRNCISLLSSITILDSDNPNYDYII